MKLANAIQGLVESTEGSRLNWVAKRVRAQPWTAPFEVPRWQAHRGYWQKGLRQNSLEALIEAGRVGAQMVEFDVRLTADRVPVLFHDEHVRGADGDLTPVHLLSLQDLRSREPVATLAEILRHPSVPPYLNVEIKSERILEEPLERYIVKVIEETESQKRILFSSFNPVSVWKVSQYLPTVPRALLVAPDLESRALREMWWAVVLPIHFLHLDERMLTANTVARWTKNQVPLAAWTVNDEDRMKELLNLGVKSLITDIVPSESILRLT